MLIGLTMAAVSIQSQAGSGWRVKFEPVGALASPGGCVDLKPIQCYEQVWIGPF